MRVGGGESEKERVEGEREERGRDGGMRVGGGESEKERVEGEREERGRDESGRRRVKRREKRS
jgi:hypothetical protein